MVNTHENAGIALLLVFGAGSATALGAMVVFFPFLVKYAKTRTLAAALGLSAGVMMYVSFVEIFQKSNLSFIAAGHDINHAHIYATGCFFGGVILMVVGTKYRKINPTAPCSWNPGSQQQQPPLQN
jgi:zinc transporter, ZIP family